MAFGVLSSVRGLLPKRQKEEKERAKDQKEEKRREKEEKKQREENEKQEKKRREEQEREEKRQEHDKARQSGRFKVMVKSFKDAFREKKGVQTQTAPIPAPAAAPVSTPTPAPAPAATPATPAQAATPAPTPALTLTPAAVSPTIPAQAEEALVSPEEAPAAADVSPTAPHHTPDVTAEAPVSPEDSPVAGEPQAPPTENCPVPDPSPASCEPENADTALHVRTSAGSVTSDDARRESLDRVSQAETASSHTGAEAEDAPPVNDASPPLEPPNSPVEPVMEEADGAQDSETPTVVDGPSSTREADLTVGEEPEVLSSAVVAETEMVVEVVPVSPSPAVSPATEEAFFTPTAILPEPSVMSREVPSAVPREDAKASASARPAPPRAASETPSPVPKIVLFNCATAEVSVLDGGLPEPGDVGSLVGETASPEIIAAAVQAPVQDSDVRKEAVPETVVPNTAPREIVTPVAAVVPEAAVPEPAVPEPAASEAVVLEAAIRETVTPEAAIPETLVPEPVIPETAAPERPIPILIPARAPETEETGAGARRDAAPAADIPQASAIDAFLETVRTFSTHREVAVPAVDEERADVLRAAAAATAAAEKRRGDHLSGKKARVCDEEMEHSLPTPPPSASPAGSRKFPITDGSMLPSSLMSRDSEEIDVDKLSNWVKEMKEEIATRRRLSLEPNMGGLGGGGLGGIVEKPSLDSIPDSAASRPSTPGSTRPTGPTGQKRKLSSSPRPSTPTSVDGSQPGSPKVQPARMVAGRRRPARKRTST